MPICIYCRAGTSGSEPPDHPVLQALGTRHYALPRGDVCVACNGYLGDLDQQVCNHHHLAGLIVVAGIKGSGGRIRKAVHDHFSFDPLIRTVTITPSSRFTAKRAADGSLTIAHPGNPFNEPKFSRGLHRMALGLVAFEYGAEIALGQRFDGVRDYIRRPRDGRTVWSYYQRPTDKKWTGSTLARAVGEGLYYFTLDPGGTLALVYLNLFVDEFIVALDGELASVSTDEASAFASSESTVPKDRLSDRSWALLPRDRT